MRVKRFLLSFTTFAVVIAVSSLVPAWGQAPPTAGRTGSPAQVRANAVDSAVRQVSKETGVPVAALRARTRVPPNATDAEILRLARAAATFDLENRQLLKQLVTDVTELKQRDLATKAETALNTGDTETFSRLVKSIVEAMQQQERAAAEQMMWDQVKAVNRSAGSDLSLEAAIEITANYLVLYPAGAHYSEAQTLLKALEIAQTEATRQEAAAIQKAKADALAAEEQRKAEEERVRLATPWRAGAKQLELSFPKKPGLFSVAYSSDGRLIAAGTSKGTVFLIDAGTGQVVRELLGAKDVVNAVAFSPDRRRVLASAKGEAHLWSTATGAYQAIIRHRNGFINDVAFSPDGKIIATASQEGQYILWSDDGKAFVREVAMPKQSEFRDSAGVAFSRNGTHLIVTKGRGGMSGNGRLLFLDSSSSGILPDSGDPAHPMISTRGGSGRPETSSDGRVFAPGNQILYSIQFKRPYCALGSLDESVQDMAFSPDGRFLAVARGGQVDIYDSKCGDGPDVRPTQTALSPATVLAKLDGHAVPIQAIAFSPDGRSITTVSADGQLTIWKESSISR